MIREREIWITHSVKMEELYRFLNLLEGFSEQKIVYNLSKEMHLILSGVLMLD